MMFGQQPDGEKGSPVKNSGFFANGVIKGGDVKVVRSFGTEPRLILMLISFSDWKRTLPFDG